MTVFVLCPNFVQLGLHPKDRGGRHCVHTCNGNCSYWSHFVIFIIFMVDIHYGLFFSFSLRQASSYINCPFHLSDISLSLFIASSFFDSNVHSHVFLFPLYYYIPTQAKDTVRMSNASTIHVVDEEVTGWKNKIPLFQLSLDEYFTSTFQITT